MNKYRVMRHYVLQGIFTFRELKTWMLQHLPQEYHADIRKAKQGSQLRWLAACSEYCSIRKEA